MNHGYGSAESLKKLNCLFKKQLFAIDCCGCFTSPQAARHHVVDSLVSGGKKTCGLLKLQIMMRLINHALLTLGSFLTTEIKDKGDKKFPSHIIIIFFNVFASKIFFLPVNLNI